MRQMEKIMSKTKDNSNLDHSTLADRDSREIAADELTQVVGGMGPMLLFRVNFSDIKGEQTDKDHKDWIMA
jgi:hypothetical protein